MNVSTPCDVADWIKESQNRQTDIDTVSTHIAKIHFQYRRESISFKYVRHRYKCCIVDKDKHSSVTGENPQPHRRKKRVLVTRCKQYSQKAPASLCLYILIST